MIATSNHDCGEKDYVTELRNLSFSLGDEGVVLHVDGDRHALSDLAHHQIARHCDIPYRAYMEMLNATPKALVERVNECFKDRSARCAVRSRGGAIYALIPVINYPQSKVTPTRPDP